jgi:hypothetical protein
MVFTAQDQTGKVMDGRRCCLASAVLVTAARLRFLLNLKGHDVGGKRRLGGARVFTEGLS